ncbi:MAG: hypothetical protein ACOYXU_13910 [Nitrospirota bacterium]
MNHPASPIAMNPTMIQAAPPVAVQPLSSCCQHAVVEALESAGSMGFLTSMTVLIMGFAVGLTTAWMLFG